jgi:hypothetical protein
MASMQNQRISIDFSLIRKAHWGIVFLCFFLPVVEGCNKKIIYPFNDLFNTNEWLQTSLFLYPFVFVLLAGFIFRALEPAVRYKVSWAIAYIFCLALTYLLWKVFLEMPGMYCAVLIVMWGIMCFGLLRCRDEYRIMDLIGWLLASLALWLFPLAFLFMEKLLFGGWLFIYANGLIVLTYLAEFLMRMRCEKKEDMMVS